MLNCGSWAFDPYDDLSQARDHRMVQLLPTISLSLPESFLEALLVSPLAVGMIDRELRYTHVNAALARLMEREPGVLIGTTLREAAPQLADQLEPELRHVLETGEAVHDLEVHGTHRNVRRVWCAHLTPVKNGDGEVGGVVVTAQEITPQHKESANLRSLFEHTSQGYCVLEVLYQGSEAVDARFLEANAAFEQHSGLQGVVGRTLSQVVPSLKAEYVPSYAWVAETGRPMHFERGTLALGRVFEVEIVRVGDPEQRRVALLFTNVTARREAQERLRLANEHNVFQLRLSDALRPINDPFEVQRVAARLVQVQLNADRVYYAEVSPDAQHVTIAFDEGALEPRVVGRHHMDSFGPTLMNDVRAGRTLLVEDAATDARLEPHEREAHLALGVRATLAHPLLKAGRLVALLVAHSGSGRQWTAEETLLLADTAERTWEALERARSTVALESNINRQAFLLRLGDALRGLDSAEEIQLGAARLLSLHLGASRAGYAQDLGDGENIKITSDYTTPGVASLRGPYRYEDYGADTLREFRAGRTVVRPDIANDPNLSPQERDAHARINIGASLNVPMLKNGRLMSVFFLNHPTAHDWTPEEVALVAQTAERTWEAAQRTRAEAESRAAAEQFTRTVEDAPIPILLQAENGEVLHVNRAWTALTGYTHSDIPTLDAWLNRAYRDGANALRDRMQDLFSGQVGIVDREFEILTRSGERRTWLLSASSPGRLVDNRRFAVVMATDLTERREALRAVNDGKVLLETILQNLPVGVLVTDSDGRTLMTNPALEAIWRGVRDLHSRDDYPAYRAWDSQGRLLGPQDWPVSRALTLGQPQGSVELRFERFDGTYGTMQGSAVPLPDAEGRVARVVAVAVDLSEQRESEERVRTNETRLRLALEGNRMVTWQLFLTTDEVVASDNFATVYGISELAGAGEGAALIWPEDLEAHRARFDRAVLEGGTYCSEFRITRPIDGRVVWIEERATALRGTDGQTEYVVGVATDVTERKATEERLRRNAETFSSLVQGAPFGVYVIDADFRLAHVSVGALHAFGDVSPLVGRDLTEVLRLIWTEPFASEAISRFRHTLQTGEPYVALSTEQRGDLAAVESYDWRIERVTLPDGRYGVVCYFHDVTHERAATRRLEEINAAQQQFVSDAAHELRAPLTSILGNLSLLRRYPDIAHEERAEMLGDAEREATRLTRLITDLLAVARGGARQEIEPERVALEYSLGAAWRTARSLSERRRFDLGTLQPMVVLGNPDALQQLFLIVLENAVKYSPEDGAVRLELRAVKGWVEVRVHNDGAGIPDDELERVFERFYRTDRSRTNSTGATGTGLGLTIARQIVERHGGQVWLESEGGQGTTAVVRLPRLPNDSAH